MHARLQRRAATGLAAVLATGFGTLGIGALGIGPAAAQEATDDLREAVEAQGKEIERLRQQIDATAASVEEKSQGDGWWNRTSVGGYGELHYNGGNKDEIDFHRFVLFFNHEFNDRLRMNSEMELEHAVAGDGQNGEIELEQAYIEGDITNNFIAKAGLFLMPVGLLNETHEPPTFFGVERNAIETNIIPTTWWEGGGMLTAKSGTGLSADVAFTSGLNVPTTGGNAFKVRNGRQKVSEARATDFAYTGRVKYTAIPGVEFAVTGQYQSDVTQDPGPENEAYLISAHTDIRQGGFGLRALYARWEIDGAQPEAIGRDEQYGWYVEPSYRHMFRFGELGAFYRHSEWDNEAGDATIGSRKFRQDQIGINYWPHPMVVLKADYQFETTPNGVADDDRINLGIGFQY